MITTFDMASGEKDVVLTEPAAQYKPLVQQQEPAMPYAQPRLMTVEEAVELERRIRR